MRILIVDDTSTKIGTILNTLREIENFKSCDVTYALDLNTARQYLINDFFDILIMDLNMPATLGESPSMEAGTAFIDEIMDSIAFKKPTDIVALTAFDESAQVFKGQVEHAGFLVLQYDETSVDWKNILKARIAYLMICHEQWEVIPRLPKCDVAILTAVPVESDAVMALDYKWKDIYVADDPSSYHYAELSSTGQIIRIVHVQQSEMGMSAAAATTTKLIMHFKPKYIIMTGIAAGLDLAMSLGDIMIGTDIWNYNSGKYVESKTEYGQIKTILSPDPKHIPMPKALEEKLCSRNYDSILREIKEMYHSTVELADSLHLQFGLIACGGAVVASQEIVTDQITAHARKTIGLDMESYGVCYASQITTNPNIPAIIIKSISDSANTLKSDIAQPYAAFTSANFAKFLIENVLFS